MRTATVVVVVAALCAVALGLECKKAVKCMGKGDECVELDPFRADPEFKMCKLGYPCIEKKCYDHTLEEKCELGCIPPPADFEAYGCEDSKCVFKGLPGDTCESDKNCLVGKCKDKLCEGVTGDDPCPFMVGDKHCHPEYFCKDATLTANGKCVKREGGEGDEMSKGCKLGLVVSKDGKCMKPYSLKEGAECMGTQQCETSLGCLDGKCVKGKKYSSKLTTCSSDSDCKGDGNKCTCNPLNGKNYCDETYDEDAGKKPAINCNKEDKAYLQCRADNKCHDNVGMSKYAKDTCATKHCKSKAKATYKCTGMCAMKQYYDGCISKELNSLYCGSSATIIIVIILIIIIIAAAAIICYCLFCRSSN